MKKINKILSIIPLSLSLMSFKSLNYSSFDKEIIIMVNEKSELTSKNKLIEYLDSFNIKYKTIDNLSENISSKYYCFTFENEDNYLESFNKLKNLNDIVYVEENKIVLKSDDISNKSINENNIQLSSNSSSNKAHYELIRSEEAKKLPGENNKINVAIIDAPINLNSSILKQKIDKTYSKEFNQRDSDEVNKKRMDHGCAVSYIIGGTSNNSSFSSGICENVNIIALTIPEYAEISDFVKIMNYLNSLQIEVPLTNCSYSMGSDNSNIMKQSIMDYNGLFICAAANEHKNLDDSSNKIFPAQYSLDNMIVVGESTTEDNKSLESNYGKTTVDIFAPGYNIISIDDNDEFYHFTGTSFAAPLVTGACALMLSKNSSLTSYEIKSKVMFYADKVNVLKNYCVNGNRLNVFSAIHEDNHENTYKWLNTKKHNKICSVCDDKSLEGHIVSGSSIINNKMYGTCLLCNGSAEMGFITQTCSLNSLEEYDFINGLYYPKTTKFIDGILQLSYKDGLNYEKK